MRVISNPIVQSKFAAMALAAIAWAATATPASADYETTRCDRDGDHCWIILCDDDGDDCRRISDFRPAPGKWGDEGWDWRRRGWGRGWERHVPGHWACDGDRNYCQWVNDLACDRAGEHCRWTGGTSGWGR